MNAYETQRSVEHMYSKRNIRKYLESEISQSDEITGKIDEGVELLDNFRSTTFDYASKNLRMEQLQQVDLRDLIIEILMVVLPIQRPMLFTSVVGQLCNAMGFSMKKDGVVTIAEILAVLSEVDLYDITKESAQASLMICSNYGLPEKLDAFIKQAKYLPPMVCPPNIVTQNFDSGYLTFKESMILKNNYHEGDICLDSINKFNQVPLSLDVEMLKTYSEVPKAFLKNPEHKEQWEKMVKDSIKVFSDLVKQGNQFWITHKTDKRGRTYAQGYHCSYQGNSFRKAIINLADKEIVDGI
jgi:hypothetical protein